MAPRASWKGFLNLSLVSVPVKAYSANDSTATIRLNQLHETCNSRIQYKTFCPSCGEISRKETVKGYEYAKDQYVVIDLEELEKLRAKDAGRAIRIDKFLSPEEIDVRFFSETSYYLVPDGAPGQKPYSLLKSALETKDLVCIARVVLHNKDQLVLVRPVEGILCMTVLRYHQEIKPVQMFLEEIVDADVTDDEFKLAETLIHETTVDEFDFTAYHDTYHERLDELIQAKVDGKEIVAPEAADDEPVVDLMQALKASVARVKAKPVLTKKKKATKAVASGPMKKVAKSKPKPAKSSKKKKTSTKSKATKSKTKKSNKKQTARS